MKNETNSTTQAKSILAPYIEEVLNTKRAQGFKYSKEENILKSFDAFCCERRLFSVHDVTKSFIRQWLEWKHPYYSDRNYVSAL